MNNNHQHLHAEIAAMKRNLSAPNVDMKLLQEQLDTIADQHNITETSMRSIILEKISTMSQVARLIYINTILPELPPGPPHRGDDHFRDMRPPMMDPAHDRDMPPMPPPNGGFDDMPPPPRDR